MQKFKWEDLRYFFAVARSGNLSGAARSLRVNHSTVFRRINSLEETLGTRLFERLPEGYVLTGPGEEMLNSVSQINDQITAMELRLSGDDHRLTGMLRVTTTDSIGQVLLQPHLYAFHKAYPDIQIELMTDNIFFNLSRREADVAVRPTNSPPEGLVGRKICSIAWAVYGSREYIKCKGKPRNPEDLAQQDIILTDARLSHITAIRWVRHYVPEEAIKFKGGSVVTMFAAAKHGFGLSPLPCWLGDSEPGLIRVLPPLEDNNTDLWLLTLKELRHTARVRVFMEFMADSLARDRSLPGKTSDVHHRFDDSRRTARHASETNLKV